MSGFEADAIQAHMLTLGTRLQHHVLPDSRLAEPVPDLHDYDRRQRMLDAYLILHH